MRNLAVCFTLLTLFYVASNAQVKVYEEPVTYPSYGLKEAEIMPDWRVHRYPYTMFDRLTNEKGTRTYKALYVENEYVKAMVIPELGGRLHGAEDKTNGYQFLYDQKVIKPGLIALTGAWISGGVEWNFPIGHRPSGFRDTDWTITENPDGSKSAWVGEIERLKGMRWSIGTTVHPGRNWVETKVRLENCTPYVQSFQYWATSAVRATPEYQARIPGEIVTGHGKHEFFRWPVDKGVDISYWKNTPGASSYFSVDSESDFFGGYSPEEQAGFVHVADHHIVRGKKLWTWGTAPAGRLWEKILTDGDLPYFEPQAGAYSDNQPSLFWLMPGETKIFSHYWFPVRDIGAYDYANLEGSLELGLEAGKAVFGWSPTGKNSDAKVVVSYDGEEIFSKICSADPGKPFKGEVRVPQLSDLYKLRMVVLSSAGDTLLAYSHTPPLNPPFPEPATAPPSPREVKSQDLLYVYGDRFYRYNDPASAVLYFEEALKRDPGDVRSNTALGEIALKNGLYSQALDYFNTSLERDDSFFKAWYYKGLTQLWLGDLKAAEKCLSRSSYGLEWYAYAHFELAQLAASQNKYQEALDHINLSLGSNFQNSRAHAVKALVLAKMEQYEEAMEVLRVNLKADPLDLFSKYLECSTAKASGMDDSGLKILQKEFLALSRFDGQNHIEVAIRLARCGDYADALEVFRLLEEGADNLGLAVPAVAGPSGAAPLVEYYKASYLSRLGRTDEAHSGLDIASKTNPLYCFPYRLETIPVLEWALSENPDDALAHHLLASLFMKFDRTGEARVQWERAVELDPSNEVACRNLGLVYFDLGDLNKASKAYEAGLKANPAAGRIIIELGPIYRELGMPLKEQLAFYEANLEVVKDFNPAAYQLIELYVMDGQNKEALDLLNTVHFNSWEGRYGIHQLWVQANIKQGDTEFSLGKPEKALWYYEQSLTYPYNLEVAEQPGTIHARKNYLIGRTLLAMGQKKLAKEYFSAVIADVVEPDNAYQYYRGQALEAQGKKKDARLVYENMLQTLGDEWVSKGHVEQDAQGLDPKAELKSEAVWWYSRGLALKGLGDREEGETCCDKAQELFPQVELSAFRPPRAGF